VIPWSIPAISLTYQGSELGPKILRSSKPVSGSFWMRFIPLKPEPRLQAAAKISEWDLKTKLPSVPSSCFSLVPKN